MQAAEYIRLAIVTDARESSHFYAPEQNGNLIRTCSWQRRLEDRNIKKITQRLWLNGTRSHPVVPMNNKDTLGPECPADLIKSGIRGKIADRYRQGINIVLVDPDPHKPFPDSESVNRALRKFTEEHNMTCGLVAWWPWERK